VTTARDVPTGHEIKYRLTQVHEKLSLKDEVDTDAPTFEMVKKAHENLMQILGITHYGTDSDINTEKANDILAGYDIECKLLEIEATSIV
jgi:hypothetical protein